MVITHNIMALNAAMNLNNNNNKLKKNLEKLSSGYKINRAADDAAGLAISEQMRSRIHGLEQGTNNIEQGEGYCNVADGALNEISSMLIRMKKLAVQAANGTYDDEHRENIDAEVQELKKETGDILKNTEYNGIKIWDKDSEITETIPVLESSTIKYHLNTMYFHLNTKDNTNYLTNENMAAWPYGEQPYPYTESVTGFKLNANKEGVQLVWKGYNKTIYTSDRVPWTFNVKNDSNDGYAITNDKYTVINFKDHMTEYLKKHPDAISELNGINPSIVYSTNSLTTVDDLIKSFDQLEFFPSESCPLNLSCYDDNGLLTMINDNRHVHVDVSIDYPLQVASERDMNVASDTSFVRPLIGNDGKTNRISSIKYNGSGDTIAATGTTNYAFTLNNNAGNNIGTLRTKLKSVCYSLRDNVTNGTLSFYNFSESGDEAAQIKEAISRSKVGGLASGIDNGNHDFIQIYYDLMDDNSYTIPLGKNATDSNPYVMGAGKVGELELYIPIYLNDTVEDVFDRIDRIKTIDIYAGSDNSDSGSSGQTSVNGEAYNLPVITSTIDKYKYITTKNEKLIIQNSSIRNDKEEFRYDYLDTQKLGIDSLSTDTLDNAHDAISTIDNAIGIVNVQRAVFGAYTNRLEHVHSNNMNANENVTAAESRIRDTDMATEVARYSKNNVLSQASMALLAQANQSAQSVLQLLQ